MARLNVRDAARYVGLAMSTLNGLRTTGKGPLYLKLGRAIRYDTNDLDEWVNSHKQVSTADRPEFRLRRRRRRTRMGPATVRNAGMEARNRKI